MVKVLLCHNPNAGNKGHDRDSLKAALKLAGHDVRYASVKDEKFVAAFDKSVDLIVAAGGDGTIASVLTQIPDRSVPVALLPLGTANNFARSLGIAGTPQELVEMWDPEHTCPVSLGSVTGHWGTSLFLEAYGVGVFPQFLLDAKKGKKPEGARNLQQGRELLQKALKRAKPIEVSLTIGDKKQELELLGIEVCNIAFTGPGLPLAAKADVSDDKLDIVMFEADERKALMKWLEAPQDDEPPATFRKGTEVEITFRDAPTRLDDESYEATGGKHSIDIVCEETPLNVVIPIKHPVQKTPEKKAAAS
ncbi:diacylglycerol kinase family protein [Pseudolabrys sp. FHR47]|uniref:diacylglycerol/lipid kinase family protein n=1 Tax=Pseudolabrys sp. FHR47 TaxID=2562284 RepID=UPI0010BE43CD|nr:diacylglycerol kinase family protein [Pseudolabrys sp. FHR47]